jgi:AraC-like DNA-binding protein
MTRPPAADLRLWSGRLRLWPGRALWVGQAADTAPHAHHAVQVCVGLDGDFGLRRSARQPWRRYRAALVAADQPHQLAAGATRLALLYLDPESDAARALGDAAAVTPLDDLQPPNESNLDRLAAALLDQLLPPGARPRPRGDARLPALLERLRAGRHRDDDAPALAASVHLSPGRLAQVFRAATGVSLRSYRLWLRLLDAVTALAGGASLTSAAHAAGFADSAHLSRTFRRMFGIAPSAWSRGLGEA